MRGFRSTLASVLSIPIAFAVLMVTEAENYSASDFRGDCQTAGGVANEAPAWIRCELPADEGTILCRRDGRHGIAACTLGSMVTGLNPS